MSLNKVIKRTVILLTFVFLNVGVWAQTSNIYVHINQIQDQNYPKLRAYVSVEDKKGDPVLSLVRGNFTPGIDGNELAGEMEIASFQYTEKPIAYGVILSTQGLMAGEPIARQKEALLDLIDYMRDYDTLSVYLMDEEPVTLFENLTKAEVDTELINNLESSDYGRKVFDSIVSVGRKLSSSEIERKAIILISDGRDQESRYDQETAQKILNELGIPVFPLGLRVLGGQYLNVLDELAHATGGSYRYNRRFESVPDNTLQIQNLLMQSYVLEFKAKELPADDQVHQMMVKVVDKEVESTDYKNFTAVKVPFPLWLKIVVAVIVVILLILLIILSIIKRNKERKKMGITKRKCPVCKKRMKDDWDDCPFCKYLEPKKKNKKKNKDD
ncbi:VWA domain-containing protein [Spirochaeta cellobiosiphila]|uniref:VWA domain-containing protein n=1 Tax=Spirochaeta cellobiosiphila TaxID=504483 RepID=UPI0003FCA476|nr:VWA domain-containing protein [Spirochaeta cellobiosiphila]